MRGSSSARTAASVTQPPPSLDNDAAGISATERVEQLMTALGGGVISLASGDTLAIPAGALPFDANVSVAEYPPSKFEAPTLGASDLGGVASFASAPRRFGPAGLRFASPVTVVFTLPTSLSNPSTVALFNLAEHNGTWLRVGGGGIVDVAARKLRANLTHFSIYAPLVISQPSAPPSAGAIGGGIAAALAVAAIAGLLIYRQRVKARSRMRHIRRIAYFAPGSAPPPPATIIVPHRRQAQPLAPVSGAPVRVLARMKFEGWSEGGGVENSRRADKDTRELEFGTIVDNVGVC